jgi:predicted nucleotidyltransferase
MSSAVVTEGAAVLVEIWGSAQRREERTTADLDIVSNIC